MKTRIAIVLALVPAALAATALSARTERPRPAPSPAARQVGPPVSCIPLNQVRETRVRDDWTIDFMRDGKRGWRNSLRSRCSGLRAANAITYETSLTQLCTTDIVYSLETAGGLHRGPSCNTGEFVPIEIVGKR